MVIHFKFENNFNFLIHFDIDNTPAGGRWYFLSDETASFQIQTHYVNVSFKIETNDKSESTPINVYFECVLNLDHRLSITSFLKMLIFQRLKQNNVIVRSSEMHTFSPFINFLNEFLLLLTRFVDER